MSKRRAIILIDRCLAEVRAMRTEVSDAISAHRTEQVTALLNEVNPLLASLVWEDLPTGHIVTERP